MTWACSYLEQVRALNRKNLILRYAHPFAFSGGFEAIRPLIDQLVMTKSTMCTHRRRSWKSTISQVLQTVIFIFFIWVINKAVERSYQRGFQYKDTPHAAVTRLGGIPNCSSNQYLRVSSPGLISGIAVLNINALCHQWASITMFGTHAPGRDCLRYCGKYCEGPRLGQMLGHV